MAITERYNKALEKMVALMREGMDCGLAAMLAATEYAPGNEVADWWRDDLERDAENFI